MSAGTSRDDDAQAGSDPGGLLRFRAIAGGLLALIAAPRFFLAWWDQGIFWPDEVFQTLEQAHRFAFGYGLIPWEFRLGARSWVFPGVLGLYWKALAAVGVQSAAVLVPLAKSLVVVYTLVGAYFAMKLGWRLGGLVAAVLAGAFLAAFPPLLVFDSRCMTETVSAPTVLIAAYLLTVNPNPRRLFGGGLLAALAVFFRYQNGLFVIAFLVLLLAQKRGRSTLSLVAGGVAGAVVGAAVDWISWGKPFHSFWEYAKFNWIEGRSSNWGVEPFGYYLSASWTSTGLALAVVVIGLILALIHPVVRGLALVGLSFVLIHSVVPHKEFRFILPAIPLLLTCSAIGLAQALRPYKAGAWGGVAIAGALVVLMGMRARGMTFGELGQFTGEARASRAVWQNGDDANRLFWAAGERSDLCGLIVEGVEWAGGYTYLHRRVPQLWGLNIGNFRAANYIVAPRGARLPNVYREVEAIGAHALFRRDGGCAYDQAYFTWFMPGP